MDRVTRLDSRSVPAWRKSSALQQAPSMSSSYERLNSRPSMRSWLSLASEVLSAVAKLMLVLLLTAMIWTTLTLGVSVKEISSSLKTLAKEAQTRNDR